MRFACYKDAFWRTDYRDKPRVRETSKEDIMVILVETMSGFGRPTRWKEVGGVTRGLSWPDFDVGCLVISIILPEINCALPYNIYFYIYSYFFNVVV